MIRTYRLQELPDGRWAVLVTASGEPVTLAGIPQTGLSRIEAEITLDVLAPREQRPRAA